MSEATFIVGDVFDALADMPDASVDLVLTSPPFLALKGYVPVGHADKAKEIGWEPNPAAYIDTLLALTAELGRVLAPHGSIAVEIGDTYAGSGGSGGDHNPGGFREGQPGCEGSAVVARRAPPSAAWRLNSDGTVKHGAAQRVGEPQNQAQWLPANGGPGWPEAKSMCLVPELYRTGLAYGVNPLTAQASPAGRWLVRNCVRWYRPNPKPGAQGDKFWPATSDMVIATRSPRRYFDGTAARVPGAANTPAATGEPATRPPHDTWVVKTRSFRGAHYATWPPELCTIPIESMCPRRVCVSCGEPSRRIVEPTAEHREHLGSDIYHDGDSPRSVEDRLETGCRSATKRIAATRRTVGWSACDCTETPQKWRRGVVLDAFAGSGTTLAVATGMGRDAIGIDFDARNVLVAADQVGMFMTVRYLPGSEPVPTTTDGTMRAVGPERSGPGRMKQATLL